MMTVEQIIHFIKALPHEDKWQVANYLVLELEDQELKEELELAIQEYDDWKRTGVSVPAEVVFSKLEAE